MKIMTSLSPLRVLLSICASLILAGFAQAAPLPSGTVGYGPLTKVIQANQPVVASYPLTITSPGNLPGGSSITLTLSASVLVKPLNVSDTDALSFITFSTPTVTFTAPNQQQVVQVSFTVPAGDYVGSYSYLILPTGWPANLVLINPGSTLSAQVNPPQSTDDTPPAVSLHSPQDGAAYVYLPVTGQPVTVPINAEAVVGPGGTPITDIQAFLDDAPVSISSTGMGTLNATATGAVQLTTPGVYTIRVDATNAIATSSATADVTVVVEAPAPEITSASPGVNAVFTYPAGGNGVTVPVGFTAVSAYGNITAAAATLNGAPIALNLSGVNSSLTATGSASLTLTAPGDYVLVLTASNAYGDAVPLAIPFKVQTSAVLVTPTVAIQSPTSGEVFTQVQGAAAAVVNYAFTGVVPSGAITSVKVTVDGQTITPGTLTGLNTANVSGGGALSYSAAGTHTLTVTVSNGDASATTSRTFVVKQSYQNVAQDLIWLPPISLNKTVKGGSMMPIKFRLTSGRSFIRDTATVIAIYEVYANGSISDPVIYPYGANSDPNPPDYAITGEQYHLNFTTAPGVHRYRIEVYHTFPDTTYMQLLGSKELQTK